MPSMPSAQTGRTLIAAMSAGAVGVTAAIVATGGMAPVTPQQPADVQLAANPAAAPAAAAFALAPGQTEEAGHAAAPVTGADLAAAAQPSAAPLPTSVATPEATAPATESAAASAATGTPTPVPLEPDAADTARNAAEKAAAAAAKADAAAKKAPKTDPEPKVGAASSAGAKALAFAKSEIGTPYRYGATGPSAYDCSGLVMAAFKKAGVSLPRTSAAQSKVGTPVSRDQLKPGDLVFFYSPVSHVGIYLGAGKIVHASTSGEPVKISDMGRRPFHNARRV
jgi:cell wall-associated NlpC family hydrolase